jgi:hypothetical protein
MYRKLIFAAVAASSDCLGSATASAMPNGLPKIEIENAVNVRWVCNPWGVAGGGPAFTAPTVSMVDPVLWPSLLRAAIRRVASAWMVASLVTS